MEIIGLDRHTRASQRSIKADDGTITDRRIATNRDQSRAVHRRVRSAATGPHPARGEHGARVGGPSPGVPRARGDRRGPERRADVRQSVAPHHDRHARCAHADGRVRDGCVASRVSAVGSAAPCAGRAGRAGCACSAEALALLATVDIASVDGHHTFHLSESYAMAGDIARALELAERAVEMGFFPPTYITRLCPFYAPLRDAAGFERVAGKAAERVAQFDASFSV